MTAQQFLGSDRANFEPFLDPEPRLHHAIQEIFVTYGDRVSVHDKGKGLLKFGRTANADNGARTTVANFQDAVINETFSTTNDIDQIVSTNDNDDMDVVVEGHTIADGLLTFVSQTVTLTGQTKAALTTPLARATRAYIDDTAAPAGDVAVFVDGTLTTGKPDTDADVKLMIAAGKAQSEKCATAIGNDDYWIITDCYAGVNRQGSATRVDIELEWASVGKVLRSRVEFPVASDTGIGKISFEKPLIVPKNSDFRMIATASADNTTVYGGVNGYLASVVS